jgi:glycerophosphoryl diester phosphodiesterase
LGIYIDSVQYMPIIKLGKKGYKALFNEVLEYPFEGVEFTFASDTIPEVAKFHEFEKKGTRVWVNALWSEHNGGHHDDRALKDPDSAYGWLISKGVNMIQTDRPQLLLEYLRKKNLHN